MEGGDGVWHQGGGQHWVAAGLGVTLAVLLPGRAGCPRALGRERCWAGSRKGGPSPEAAGDRWGAADTAEEREAPGNKAATAQRRGGGGVRAEDGAAGPGSASHAGAPGAAPPPGPARSPANPNPGRAGAGPGWQGPGLVAARDPRRALAGAPVSPAAWGPRRGPPGSCGKGEGKGPRCGGSGGRPRAGDSAGPGRGGVIGTWGGWPAGRSSGHCRWSRGEAGSWRGIWLSCWTCTAEDREAGGQQGAGLGGGAEPGVPLGAGRDAVAGQTALGPGPQEGLASPVPRLSLGGSQGAEAGALLPGLRMR